VKLFTNEDSIRSLKASAKGSDLLEALAPAPEQLVSGKTQVAVAEAVGVTDRTIRNWAKTKSFQRELESPPSGRRGRR
jgi:predicted transcriptional regulator